MNKNEIIDRPQGHKSWTKREIFWAVIWGALFMASFANVWIGEYMKAAKDAVFAALGIYTVILERKNRILWELIDELNSRISRGLNCKK